MNLNVSLCLEKNFTFSRFLNCILSIRNMHHSDLSKMITDLSVSSTYSYVKGISVPKLKTLEEICKVLNVDKEGFSLLKSIICEERIVRRKKRNQYTRIGTSDESTYAFLKKKKYFGEETEDILNFLYEKGE